MTTTQRTTCVVAGGGPAGMVLGLLLARAGIEVTVFEKHGDFLRDFRGDTVHPSTLRLLDELGLTEKFAALPYSKVDRFEFPDANGNSILLGDYRKLPGRYQYIAMVPQWDLLDLLADAGKAEPTFTLRMNTEVLGTITERGRVVGVRYRDADGVEGELRATLTVATDGRWSTLRTAAGLRPHEYPVPVDTWWFRLPKEPGDRTNAFTMHREAGEIALTIDRTDYYQVAYFNEKGMDPALRAAGLDSFRDRIARVIPGLADRVDQIESMDDVKVLDIRLNRLPRWYVDGLLCIGDAAHAMSPAGGVGINLAIQDAVATATLLATPLRRGQVRPRDLARVQRRRLPATMLVQGLQRMLHRVMFAASITDGQSGPPAALMALSRMVPGLRFVPAYLVGIGFRPERAPAFARR